MKEELSITNERIDDFVVLLRLMQQMDLPGMLDRHLPRHWLQQGLSWGWTASIWLAHIVSQGDHRKLTVREWVRQAHDALEQVSRVLGHAEVEHRLPGEHQGVVTLAGLAAGEERHEPPRIRSERQIRNRISVGL